MANNIAAMICGRLGLDPKMVSEITLRFTPSESTVEIKRIVLEADGDQIGSVLQQCRLVEKD